MSKLPPDYKFIDLSDYGRPFARWIANGFKNTRVTPVDVTGMFIIAGLLAIFCMFNQQYEWAAFFLILKSILDAADGELARVKQTPSYTGRYLDSVSDLILNGLFLLTICIITDGSLMLAFFAFLGIQLQGTLYNYYYVILRNKFDGDKTSRVFEEGAPKAMPGEKQRNVDILFWMYTLCYGAFDKAIHLLDPGAEQASHYPKWFMTAVSCCGLGFQLLIIAVMLCIGWAEHILAFFIAYSVFIFIFIAIRKWINRV